MTGKEMVVGVQRVARQRAQRYGQMISRPQHRQRLHRSRATSFVVGCGASVRGAWLLKKIVQTSALVHRGAAFRGAGVQNRTTSRRASLASKVIEGTHLC